IRPSTRLVLTNAVYFNAAWKTPFVTDFTYDSTFQAIGGDVTVPMMNGEPESMQYAAGDGYEAIALPYDGDELDMVMIVPEQGNFAAFEAGFDTSTVAEIFAGLGPSEYGALSMPKFEFRYKADLVEMFKALGMTDAFDSRADFSGMDGSRNLSITAIVHEAFVKVNEAGTEAAAATGVVVGETSAPLPFVVDRPFIFLIRDVATGTVIFLGRVTDPS
ncbi:MAG: serpin family protein, partial [Myxococcota bacterium]